MKAIAAHDQAHYPERMGVTYIVNAPGAARGVRGRGDGKPRTTAAVFGLVWRTVRPFIDPATRDKIKIVTARTDCACAVSSMGLRNATWH